MSDKILCPVCYWQWDERAKTCPHCDFPIAQFKDLLSGKPVVWDKNLKQDFDNLIEKHREISRKRKVEPILKIETGMHIAVIYTIGIDKAERFLVTGSNDKTIKVWELRTGRLIKTLRPPIGSGDEGKIYAVAISPDGRHVAGGGWTKYGSESGHTIYIFDLKTGSLVQRCSGLPNVILHLAYSKDGIYLAAGLWGQNGIRIYKTDDYSLIKRDSDYQDSVYGLDFSEDGRLVTTSYDGYIRFYDKNFNLIRKKKAPGGSNPFQISFSPDGSRIAVGYSDTPSVDILSANDLDKLYSADTEGFSGCNFGKVTFSFDGSFLYAGGTCGDPSIIRCWERAGKGRYIEVPVADNTIMHILPLKDGGVVFGSAEPSFGILDASGRLAFYKGNTIADLRGQWDEFQVSYDGSVVRFGYEVFGKSLAVFDAERREFVDETSVRLSKPITQMQGLEITDWKNSYHPKLNGKPIELEQYEISRSLAIAPDGKRFLLGTGWWLRLYERNGNEIWKVPVPGAVWAVNISGNGKVAVAGFGDGTIRWFRMEDGKELLAFFPHKDKKRWVIWTPKGYYDASPDGEELIGWHVNKGKDKESEFYPVSEFKHLFHRPEVIKMIFKTYDEKHAVALASEEEAR
jgi:WD40 repeat protein